MTSHWRQLTLRAMITVVMGSACSTKESEPASAARAYVAALQSGDTARVLPWLDPAVLSQLEAAAQRATDQVGGRRQILAPEMLQITGFDPLFVIDSVVEVSNDAERAHVQVIGASGQVEDLMLINTDAGWKIALRVPVGIGVVPNDRL